MFDKVYYSKKEDLYFSLLVGEGGIGACSFIYDEDARQEQIENNDNDIDDRFEIDEYAGVVPLDGDIDYAPENEMIVSILFDGTHGKKRSPNSLEYIGSSENPYEVAEKHYEATHNLKPFLEEIKNKEKDIDER